MFISTLPALTLCWQLLHSKILLTVILNYYYQVGRGMIKDGNSAPVSAERVSASFWKRQVGESGLEGLQLRGIKSGTAPLESKAHWKTSLLQGLGGL